MLLSVSVGKNAVSASRFSSLDRLLCGVKWRADEDRALRDQDPLKPKSNDWHISQ